MSLPALHTGADTRSITERVNVLIRDYNSGRVDQLAALWADTRTLQVVSFETGAVATGTTQIPIDDTIPQQTEGDQYMSLAITPKSATSRLIVDVVWNGALSTGPAGMTVALFRDSGANALAAQVFTFAAGGTFLQPIRFRYIGTSGAMTASTFKVRAGGNIAGTTTFNGFSSARKLGGVLLSSITVGEVLP